MRIKNIGIIVNPHKKEIFPFLRTVAQLLHSHKCSTALLNNTNNAKVSGVSSYTLKRFIDFSDLILSFGGDGTLLSAARSVGKAEIPIMGINFGGLGFLTSINTNEFEASLSQLLAGNFKIENRMMHHVRIVRKKRVIKEFSVLNDLVIGRSELSRLMRLSVKANKTFITTYYADGLIISTPTGSTAYSLSAGGPILTPTMCAMVITPICPHSLSARSMILSPDDTLSIHVDERDAQVQLTIDGQIGYPLRLNDAIEVKQEQFMTRLIVFKNNSFYEVLRNKLQWAVRNPK